MQQRIFENRELFVVFFSFLLSQSSFPLFLGVLEYSSSESSSSLSERHKQPPRADVSMRGGGDTPLSPFLSLQFSSLFFLPHIYLFPRLLSFSSRRGRNIRPPCLSGESDGTNWGSSRSQTNDTVQVVLVDSCNTYHGFMIMPD